MDKCREGEQRRDRDRWIITAVMHEALGAFHSNSSSLFSHHPYHLEQFNLPGFKKMPRKGWLKTAWIHHLCIKDWPRSVFPPGPGLTFKMLGSEPLKTLVRGYRDNLRNNNEDCVVPTVTRWSPGESTVGRYCSMLTGARF